MATKKSGPIKPPIIDLEANKSTTGQAKQKKASTNASSQEKPTAQKEKSKSKLTGISLNKNILTIIAGAILGVVISVILAFTGFWPVQSPPANLLNSPAEIVALSQRLDNSDKIINQNSGVIEGLGSEIKILQQVLKSNSEQILSINKTQQEIVAQVTKLETTSLSKQDLPAPIDLAPLQKRLTILDDKVATIDAGANSADASAIVNSISLLREQADLLNKEIASLKLKLENNGKTISNLENLVQQSANMNKSLSETIAVLQNSKTKTLLIPQTSAPIIAFENAINSGRPFFNELGAIKSIMPDIIIPEGLKNMAASGFKAPNIVVEEFNVLVPKLLAVKPIDENISLGQKIAQKTLSLLAIRPIGEVSGNSAEAIISRIELALKKNDFLKAGEQIKLLPKEMLDLADENIKDIDNLSLAQKFIKTINS